MTTQPKIDILKIFANDKRLILYRPEWRTFTGSVLSTILLQQILYWWDKMGRKPFYKFKEPCGSQLYTERDSWTEELGFSRTEFDTALKKIGVKISAKNPPDPDSTHFVEYWTDINRVTYYTINAEVLEKALAEIYVNQESDFTQGGNPTLYVNQESCFTKRGNPALETPPSNQDVSSIKSIVNTESEDEEKPHTETTIIKKTTDNEPDFSAPSPTLPETASPPSSVLSSVKNNEEILQLIVALMVLIPEHHRQPIIESYLQKALKAHSFDTIKAAILYTNAHSKGTTKQYRSYLGQCLDKGWADGILESLAVEKATIEETEEAKAEKIKAAREKERLEQEQRELMAKKADAINVLLNTVDVDALDNFIETKYLEGMNSFSRQRWNKNQRDMFRRLYVKEFLAAESDPETVSPAVEVIPTISMTPAVVSAPQPRQSVSSISFILPNILEGIRPRPTA